MYRHQISSISSQKQSYQYLTIFSLRLIRQLGDATHYRDFKDSFVEVQIVDEILKIPRIKNPGHQTF
uniref:Uncharacterized protein n=1 Tax=Megaselia scalaris TaxID=36166 RepID=T1GG92_MEGSC